MLSDHVGDVHDILVQQEHSLETKRNDPTVNDDNMVYKVSLFSVKIV